MNSYLAILFLCIVFIFPLHAETYYVDANRPDDSESGLSWELAKKNVLAAVETSTEGDTIIIKYGTYTLSSCITIESERMITSDDGSHLTWETANHDSSQCILIAAADSLRIFTILSDTVTNATRIRGFSIKGGYGTKESVHTDYGGGILIASGADPVIENCRITNNRGSSDGSGNGGGIAIRNAGTDPIIQYCQIDSNIASTSWFGHGAGIFCDDYSAPIIRYNTIEKNKGSTNRVGIGGGIYCSRSDADIYGNLITYNIGTPPGPAVSGSGGGLYLFDSNVKVHDNDILYNCASKMRGGTGGGIYTDGGGQEIWNNRISYNIACDANEKGNGGGIFCGGGAHIWDNTITYNIATTSQSGTASYRIGTGGGVSCSDSGNELEDNFIAFNTASVYGEGHGGGIAFGTGQTFKNNIIAHNTASDSSDGFGGGMYGYNAAISTIANNTFYKNTNIGSDLGTGAGTGSQIYYYTTGGVYKFDIKNNIFYGHELAAGDCTAVVSLVPQQLDNNCFYNYSINYNENITSMNEINSDPYLVYPDTFNFELQYMSPCIDAGLDFFVYNELENHDSGWKEDIGAKEYTGTHVRKAVSDTGTVYFGGQVRAKMYVNTISALAEIDITVHPGENPPDAESAVQRWYETISTVSEGIDFDLTLSYKDNELNGQSESSLDLWNRTGLNWEGPVSSSDTSTAENWLTASNQSSFGSWAMSENDITAINTVNENSIIYSYELIQNYPNPFNPSTNIEFTLPKSEHVVITVYNVLGQNIRTLLKKDMPSGHHKIQFYAQDYPSGVYFYEIKAGDFVKIKKMILMR